jgi:hypothetical protein
MKKNIFYSVIAIALLSFPNISFGQTPNGTVNLGILESFEGYTGAGAITNAAGATWTGDAGTNIGIISGFGLPPSFTGNTYNADATTEQARYDLMRLYIHLNDLFVDYPSTHAPAFGGGETITPGVYSIGGAGSIGGALTLDGGGNANAFFVIKYYGAMTVGAGAVVNLIGGTQSCNVFFISDGAISAGANVNLKGTLFAKVGAVGLGADAVLEGRMLSMEGAIVNGVGANVSPPPGTCTIPIFCESGCSPAPSVDVLGVLSNYALYTNIGAIPNTGTSGINGKIGTDAGAISGFESSIVIGSFETANAATAQAKIDIDNAYNSLMALPNTVPSDAGVLPVVLLAHAAAFGSVAPGGETINAGVYFIGGAGSLTGTLVLDAQNNPNVIFVFKFAGAFSVAAQSKMILINGARRCNVFFIGGAGVPTGAISIGAGSVLKGTFLSHNGACGSGASVFLAGRQLSTGGAVNIYSGIVYNSPECVTSITLKTTAVTDNLSVAAGATTPSVIDNDMSKGVQAVIGTAPGQVTLSFTNSGPLTMNPDGTITVAVNASAGIYPITYTICEVSNPSICSTVTSTVTIANAGTVAGTITGDQIICKDSTPNDLTLTGNTGNVIKWQKSSDFAFTSPIDIPFSASTTLLGVTIGTLAETTYFRAVVQNGISPSEYSNVVTITVPSTTWDGFTWSNGVPTITTTAYITGNYSESTNIVACTLTVSNNAVVSILSGYNVTLYGKLTVETGSSFTLNSNSNLIQQTAAVNTGDITVKRISSPVYRLDYTLWSSPVSGSQTLFNFSPLTSNIGPVNIRFYTYNTLSNQFNSVDPITTTFEAAKSYLIRVPNNWIPYNASLSPAPQPWTGSFTGVPRNGTISFTMANTSSTTGINAVGNPYPSAILLDSFINENSSVIEGTLWCWRKFNENNNLVSYSTCTTVGCTANNNATYTDDNLISVGQGFMVKAKSGQTNLNFTNAMRSSGNVNQFFKSSDAPMDRYWLKMTNTTNNSTGQNLIAYTSNATNDYDSGLDGLYSNDSSVAFYSKAGTQDVVINARPSFDVTDVIPLLFKSNVAETYTFSLNQKEGIFNGTQDVLLRDNYNNVVQNLSFGDYSFNTAIGTFTDCFDIIYQNTLSKNNPTLDVNQIIIYNKDQTIFVNSGEIIMDSIKIFDIQGRLLYSKSSINDTKTSLNLNFNNQVLLFHITSQDGDTIIKKIIN